MTFLNQLKIILFALFLISYGEIYAQNVISVTAAKATGVNGDVAYAVGQLFYTSFSGSGGVVAQGIQHPKETIITLGTEEFFENSSLLTIYPNPASEFLSLDVKNIDWQNLQYKLFDVNGRTLQDKDFTGNKTQIDLRRLKPAVYFLKITENHNNIRNFKIIKTN
ncbi:MAG: T9SS type A sorting domain-containing protein [Bacteroidota bacterium]